MKQRIKQITKPITLEKLLAEAISMPNGCLESPRARNQDNYAVALWDKRQYFIHRVVCEFVYGKPQPKQLALHSCDNPPCIKPKHLRWGTDKDNAQDRVNRNREADKRGENSGNAKLTNASVLEIRELLKLGWSDTRLAEKYKVSRPTIWAVRKNQTWKHIV